MKKKIFVSAYTTAPSPERWNPELESLYFQALSKRSEIIGIEHPVVFDSQRYPLDWLLEHIPEHWSIAITTLPGFMGLMSNNPFLGLASTQEKDRVLAVKFMEKN